ncbi:MAG TPA: hypothetical protein VHG89_03810 [Verrucomicrobiae bacterium]|nr:hypothetical protein [Verrucomicrobiae bacterium]
MEHGKTIYLFVNGIATWPGNFTNWNKRAVTFTHTRTGNYAESFEYFTTPFTRPFKEDERAKNFARALRDYIAFGWKIVCVGHSNGAAVILEGLRRANWPEIAALHLVCAACEADFSKNGLNRALAVGALKKVFVYCAGNDWALKLARTIPGKILGYGTLGLHGALRVDPTVKNRVGELWWDRYGHSTCWLPHHFTATMKHFFANA